MEYEGEGEEDLDICAATQCQTSCPTTDSDLLCLVVIKQLSAHVATNNIAE